MDTMLVDCVGCTARGPACDDCVVSVLLGVPEADLPAVESLADDERAALDAMAAGGLLPPLRLARPVTVEVSTRRWRRGA